MKIKSRTLHSGVQLFPHVSCVLDGTPAPWCIKNTQKFLQFLVVPIYGVLKLKLHGKKIY